MNQSGDRGEGIERAEVEALLGVGVPITIVPTVAFDNGLPSVIVAWLGIAAVNAAHASAVNGGTRRRG